ncbi:hypothetical protein VNI00_016170 [Paramarasmius palmivorus]|uniref:Uncharacterized protein n=1 Tax=Paramarasmius palmivorus TaxID=297713 RepID=A0AAW0BD59_9AGAR
MGRKRTKSNIEYHNSGTEHPNAGKRKGGNGSKGRPRKKPRREVEERPIVLPEPEASSSEVPMITSTSLSRSASPAPSQIPQQDIEMSSSNVLDLENLPEVCSADRYRSLHTLWVETGSLPDLSSLPDPEPFNPVPYSPTESLLSISSSSSRSESVSSNNSSSSDSAPHRPRRKPFKAPPPPPEELRLEDLTLWNISSTDIANAAIYPVSDESHFPCVLFAETPRSPLAARVEDVVDEDDRDTEIHVSWTEFLHEELGVDSDEEWKECGSESEYSSDDGSVDEDEILKLYHEEGVDIAVLSEQLSHEFLPPLPVSMPPPPSSPSSDPPSESAPATDQADEEKPEWYRKWLPPPVEDASAASKDLDTIL